MVSGMLIESKHFQSDTALQNVLLLFPTKYCKNLLQYLCSVTTITARNPEVERENCTQYALNLGVNLVSVN